MNAPAAPAAAPSHPIPRTRPLYHAGHVITTAFYTLVYRLRTIDAHLVPPTGPVLIAANHQSFLDPPAIGTGVRNRPLDFIARAGLFKVPGLAALIRQLGATPVPEDGQGDTAAIREVLARLAEGRAVLIFPEGSRCDDGSMLPFKRGVAVLVKRARCPVVPVAIEGTFDAWNRFTRIPKLLGARIMIRYGNPIPHTELMQHGADAALERLAREIDAMRLDIRARLRRATHDQYPPPGPADEPRRTPQPSPMPT